MVSDELIEKAARAMCRYDCREQPERFESEWAQEERFYLGFARAALEAASSAQAPEGWQLVPTKHDGLAGMTHEMADALWRTFTDAYQHHGFYESMNAGYNAMLAAAPKVKP